MQERRADKLAPSSLLSRVSDWTESRLRHLETTALLIGGPASEAGSSRMIRRKCKQAQSLLEFVEVRSAEEKGKCSFRLPLSHSKLIAVVTSAGLSHIGEKLNAAIRLGRSFSHGNFDLISAIDQWPHRTAHCCSYRCHGFACPPAVLESQQSRFRLKSEWANVGYYRCGVQFVHGWTFKSYAVRVGLFSVQIQIALGPSTHKHWPP